MSDSEPGRGSPVLYLAFGLLAGVGLSAIAALVLWQVMSPSAPKPTPPAPAPTIATPAPAQRPEPTPEPPPSTLEAEAPTPLPSVPPVPARTPPKTKPAPLTPELASLLKQANSAAQEHRYEVAAGLYDEILKRDPQNAQARAWKANANALRRTFIESRPEAENVKGAPGRLQGFDTGDVEVKRPADVPARLELDVSPTRVKPGDGYTVKIYLLNTGKKAIKINDMNVAKTVNGTRSAASVVPRAKEIEPKDRALLDVLPGVWADDTASWSLQVLVRTSRGDSYLNEIVWK
jgi:hypothetical protein